MTRVSVWLLARLPLSIGVLLGRCLSILWWYIVPIRRDVAIKNVELALPEVRASVILRDSVYSMFLSFVELLHYERRPYDGFELVGWDSLIDRANRGVGSLVLTGHGAGWELVGAVASTQLKLPVTVIVKRPSSPNSARIIERIRTSFGLELLEPEGSFWLASQALARGRVVVFLLDQRHNGGISVPFFGRDALTSKGLALLAKRSGVPVFPAWQVRLGTGQHLFEIFPAMTLSGDVRGDTSLFMRFYEERIRENPSGWLWLHDRWRDKDIGANGED